MKEVLWLPLLIITPAVVGGVLHSVAIKLGLLRGLAVPLSIHWFGSHKTYRGFVLMPLGCVLGVYLATTIEAALPMAYHAGFGQITGWVAGLALGLAYMLFELPNSFAKRRLGVVDGMLAAGSMRPVFLVADQVDSVIGCVVVCALFFDVSATVLLATLTIGVGAHMATNLALYLAGVRSRPV
jgi:hypothetical protein